MSADQDSADARAGEPSPAGVQEVDSHDAHKIPAMQVETQVAAQMGPLANASWQGDMEAQILFVGRTVQQLQQDVQHFKNRVNIAEREATTVKRCVSELCENINGKAAMVLSASAEIGRVTKGLEDVADTLTNSQPTARQDLLSLSRRLQGIRDNITASVNSLVNGLSQATGI